MADDRVTVRLGEDRKRRYADDAAVNLSGLLRELVDAYDRTGDSLEAGLKRRLKDEEAELRRLREQMAGLQSDIDEQERLVDELQDKVKQRQQSVPEEVIEFAEGIRSGRFREDQLDTDNPAVKNWAGKANIHPEQFVREVNDRL